MDRPPDTMVEEKEELMFSPTGGDPFHKIAHFLKPIVPSSIFKFPNESFSSLPSHFGPRECPLEVEFPGWRIQLQEDWTAWVDRLASLHQSTWKKAGIYEAIFNSTYQIRRNTELIYGLAEKWCSETNSFIFAWGEATITLEDLIVMGSGGARNLSILGHDDFCNKI
ncbi:putative aminotransferase-like, plant mobile domain-containing protein [Rosa chinensis]|uniref:Putative aminotransferase-like, plant mobile domain-containing protein n=1 Tax=Rosa chinensis TaxID=74649 RepID=A0A2P6QC13_ROSCH|nr:putative aminotransferase-like, plant mobile domain-containing protein [Rosa chinensis]